MPFSIRFWGGPKILNLAFLYQVLGRPEDSEPAHVLALAAKEAAFGANDPRIAVGLINYGKLLGALNRYDEASEVLQRALAIFEANDGGDDPKYADALGAWGSYLLSQGQIDLAENAYRQAVALQQRINSADHYLVGMALGGLARVNLARGLDSEAEAIYARSLEIIGNTLGPRHSVYANVLNNIARIYFRQGRYSEAAPLYERSLEIKEAALGPDHPGVGAVVNNLAQVYAEQGSFDAAERLYRRAIANYERAYGPDNRLVASGLNTLGNTLLEQGRLPEAEVALRRAFDIREAILAPDNPAMAKVFSSLGQLDIANERFASGAEQLGQALSIVEGTYGARHPDNVEILGRLFTAAAAQDQPTEALDYIRRANDIVGERVLHSVNVRRGLLAIKKRVIEKSFQDHVGLINKLVRSDPLAFGSLVGESFSIAQLAQATSTSGAVAQMAARFGTGDDRLANLVRGRQDIIERQRLLDTQIFRIIGGPPTQEGKDTVATLRRNLAGLDRRLEELDIALGRDFPEYAEMANPQPSDLGEIMRLLKPNEALIAYLLGPDESFMWVLRSNRAILHRLGVTSADMNDGVAVLRSTLDPTFVETIEDIPAYDVDLANELYRQIFEPAEASLAGAEHIIVVPSGALQSLPFGVLVSELPDTVLDDFDDYRGLAWLAKRFAFTTIPSVGSLRALRRFAQNSTADQPFVGFGDPELGGGPGETRGLRKRGAFLPAPRLDTAGLFLRGSAVDVEAVRSLPPLPETARELASISRSVGAGAESLFLRGNATETKLRELTLDQYRIVAFATHGLVAGDFAALGEPALVMTPPQVASEGRDGLLTASEIASLRLDADWVILSACNTAAPDGTPGAEGLSGLAKAFFYAGTRSLLVSHWAVASDAAVKLTTGMFSAIAESPGLGRAEALRRSSLALLADDSVPHFAHPMFWAPYVVIGEGGALGGA